MMDIEDLDLYDIDTDDDLEPDVNGRCPKCRKWEAAERADFRLDDTCRCCPTCPAVATVLLQGTLEQYCETCGRENAAACYANGAEPGTVSLFLLPAMGRAAYFASLCRNLRELVCRAEYGDAAGAVAELAELYCITAEWAPPDGWEPPTSAETDAEWCELVGAAAEHIAEAGADKERLDLLVRGAVYNAGRFGPLRPRWSAVADALGVADAVAAELCDTFKLDRDEMVGRAS